MPALPKRKPAEDKEAKKAELVAKKAQAEEEKAAKKKQAADDKAAKKAKLEEEKAAKKAKAGEAKAKKKAEQEARAEEKKRAKEAKSTTPAKDRTKGKAATANAAAAARAVPTKPPGKSDDESEEESSEELDDTLPARSAKPLTTAVTTPTRTAPEDDDEESSDDDDGESSSEAETGNAPVGKAPDAQPSTNNPLEMESSDEEEEEDDDDDEDDESSEEEETPPPPPKPKIEKPNGPAFAGAGDAPGVLVWRIEALHPTPVDKAFYGKFYSGDSYIILHTIQEKSGSFSFDLYFWLGEESSTDEQGTAAILSAQLDDKLGGAPVQHRIAQGFEPPAFTALMGGTLEYLEGGCASGFNHVVPDVIPTRLLQVKGLKECRVEQVKKTFKSLNSGDVFILDMGKTVYQWNGKEASHKERGKAMEVCLGIKTERVHQIEQLGQEVEILCVHEGDGSADEHAFWAALGGDRNKVAKARPDTKRDDKKATANTTLWHLEESSSGELKFTEIKKRPLERSMLDPNDSFILVCPAEIFVWIGAKASQAERKNAMIYAQKFLNGEQGKKRPKWTPVVRVTQGAEPTAFTCKFKVWEVVAKVDIAEAAVLLRKGMSSGHNIARKIEQQPPNEIATSLTITKADMKKRIDAAKMAPVKLRSAADGSLEIWRVANFKKTMVPTELHGEFFAGDSYIVCFTYKDDRDKTAIMLYFWLGRLCSSDEKGSAALLARELDESKQKELGVDATQVRVVQNNEPDDFLALFNGKLVVRDGGLSKSGEDTRDHDGVGLFHVKSFDADTVRTVQVVEVASSLNSADCFVLQTPGLLHVWHGSLASDVEKSTASKVGHAIASRLKYTVENTDARELAELAASQAKDKVVREAARIDDDGDGIPDVAQALMLMVDADGDGISDGLHADKLGLFVPQAELVNERPHYANDNNANLVLWWSGGKWWLGKGDELGRNRGWLKAESREVVPPKEGWLVYSKKGKTWERMDGMVAIPARRIACSGKTTDDKLNERFGEFVQCADPHEGRPVFVREGRPNLMIWWNAGRWWLGKRAERGTNRGWMKAISESNSPASSGHVWTFYSATAKSWVSDESIVCKELGEVDNATLPSPAKLPPPVQAMPAPAPKQPASWEVRDCSEGSEPAEFWEAIGGKKPYEQSRVSESAIDFEPRFFECSDETGAFRVDEAFDVCQEDLEHEDVYLVDCWSSVFLWVGSDCRESERTMGMEVARSYVAVQGALDGRPSTVEPTLICDGDEPVSFTSHFVGWSNQRADHFEDPYEKRQKTLEKQASEKVQEGAEMIAAPDRAAMLRELIKKTQKRSDLGGGPPPVAAVGNGALPHVPKLQLAGVAQASSLDSARRRANAAMAAESSLSGREGVSYLDPQAHRFTLEEIREGGEKADSVNPLCKELYLLDTEFIKLFGMDKDAFWKQPHWKQREAKKKCGLY